MNVDKYIGLSEAKATELIEEDGLRFRIVARNGHSVRS